MTVELAQSLRIAAPVDQVLAFASKPEVQLRALPGLLSVGEVIAGPDGEMRAPYRVQWAGEQLEGEAWTKLTEGDAVGLGLEGDVIGELWVEARGDAGATELELRARYELPPAVSRAIGEPAYAPHAERQLEAALRDVQLALERG